MNNEKYVMWEVEYMMFFKPLKFKWGTYTLQRMTSKPMNYMDAFTEFGLDYKQKTKSNSWFEYVIRKITPIQ